MCSVYLCVRTFTGHRKSCCDIWHSAKNLNPGKTSAPLPRSSGINISHSSKSLDRRAGGYKGNESSALLGPHENSRSAGALIEEPVNL